MQMKIICHQGFHLKTTVTQKKKIEKATTVAYKKSNPRPKKWKIVIIIPCFSYQQTFFWAKSIWDGFHA